MRPQFETACGLQFLSYDCLDCGKSLFQIKEHRRLPMVNQVDGLARARREKQLVQACVVYEERNEDSEETGSNAI